MASMFWTKENAWHVVAASGTGEVEIGSTDAGVLDGAGDDVEEELDLGLVRVTHHG